MSENEISGGAEKVEEIARRNREEARRRRQGAAASGGPRAEQAACKEQQLAQMRVAAAEEKAAREKAQEEKKRRESEARKNERAAKHPRTPGFGGWLAAVVSLSVAVLALGALVTVGYFDLYGAKTELANGYRTAAYEFSEAVEELSADLGKARIAEGGELARLLSQVYAESQAAQRCVEAFPVDGQQTHALSACLNRASGFAAGALRTVTEGGTLSPARRARLAQLYEEVGAVRAAVPALVRQAQEGTADALSAAGSAYAEELSKLSRTLEALHPQPAPAPHREALAEEAEVSEEEAEQRLRACLAGQELVSVRAAGKEEGRLPAYAFEAEDGSGRTYYAQVTVRGGRLALLESFAPCGQENYDEQTCVHIARTFLEGCGFAEMEPVWVSEAGGECTVDFVPVQEDVLLYTDLVKVKVCRERGIATGLAAGKYLLHHRARTFGETCVDAQRVRANAEEKLENVSLRRALIPQRGSELLCWQVRGEYAGTLYFAYVDAATGHTAEIRAVRETDRGSLPL